MSMPYTPSYPHPLSQNCSCHTSPPCIHPVVSCKEFHCHFASHSSGQEIEGNQWQQYSGIDIYKDTPSQLFTSDTHGIKQDTLIINFCCPVLYLLHLCNVSIIWFPIIIHTSCLLLLSIKPLSLLSTFMGVSLWVYACQMFSAPSAEARPLDSHGCSGKELPVTPR